MTAGRWLPPLYLKLFPLAPPTSVEPMIMGMPLAFDRRAAGAARASVQFRVSGAEPGNYWVRIGDGRCESFEGIAPAPDLVVHTPDTVWMRIVRGELDGAQALAAGLFHIDGAPELLAAFRTWFSRGSLTRG
jgi:SCP-2 sterol transfer family protein